MENKIEYKRCVSDPTRLYIIENYLLKAYATLNTKCKVEFIEKLTESQKNVLRKMAGQLGSSKNGLYINKSRCCGLTTLFALKIASEIILSEGNETFVIYSCNMFNTENLISKILCILENMKEDLWTSPCDTKNLTLKKGPKISIGNGCELVTVQHPYDIKNISTENINSIYLDEFLYSENSTVMTKLLLELKENSNNKMNGTKIFFGSTPKNSNPLCYDMAKLYLELNSYIKMKPIKQIDRVITVDAKNLMNEDESGIIFKKTYLEDEPCEDSCSY